MEANDYMEIIIWLIVMIPVSTLFSGIGIYAWKRKKPMWFWAGNTIDEGDCHHCLVVSGAGDCFKHLGQHSDRALCSAAFVLWRKAAEEDDLDSRLEADWL